MKATGIVRRIDDLGRIVIPKEIRRTLRIHEGDPLEIYTDIEEKIVLKKYSPVGEVFSSANQYAAILSKITDTPSMICDCEKIIASSGISKKEVNEKPISDKLSKFIKKRQIYVYTQEKPLYPIKNLDLECAVCAPIISSGDLNGAVMFLKTSDSDFSDVHVKLAQSIAMVLAQQIAG